MTPTRAQFRKYLRVLAGAFAVLAGLLAAFNLLVDPFGVYRVWSTPKIDPYKSQLNRRIAQGERIHRSKVHTLLLGSSRLGAGVPMDAELWGTPDVQGLALFGTNYWELFTIYQGVAREKQELKRVVIFADFLMFQEGHTESEDMVHSRFAAQFNPIDYHMKNLLGMHATKHSQETLYDWKKGKRSLITLEELVESRGHRRMLEDTIRTFLVSPRTYYYQFQYSPDRVAKLARTAEVCREKGIELIIAISPVHALELETVRNAGLWELFEKWKGDLVRAVNPREAIAGGNNEFMVWDFTGYKGFVTEPFPPAGDVKTQMKYYFESSHFRKELGRLAVQRMLGTSAETRPGEDFGVVLTQENVQANNERIRREYEEYAKANPGEIVAVAEIARKARRK